MRGKACSCSWAGHSKGQAQSLACLTWGCQEGQKSPYLPPPALA